MISVLTSGITKSYIHFKEQISKNKKIKVENMLYFFVKVKVALSCLMLCDPMDYSSPGSSVHGMLQARVLECIAIPLSWRSSQPKD